MKHYTTFLSALLLTSVLAVLPRMEGAEKIAPPQVSEAGVAVPKAELAWVRRIAELTSDNLPLGEVVKHLRELFPELNFVIKNQEADLEEMLLEAMTALDATDRALVERKYFNGVSVRALASEFQYRRKISAWTSLTCSEGKSPV